MIGILNLFTIGLLVLAASACAEPKYLQKNIVNNSNTSNEQKLGVVSCSFSGELPNDSCRLKFNESNLCVSIQTRSCPDIASKTMGSLQVKLFRLNVLDNTPVLTQPEADLKLQLWMPSMGHGSSPVVIENVDVGTYLIKNLFFIMPGDWEIRIQLQKGDIKDEIKIPVSI